MVKSFQNNDQLFCINNDCQAKLLYRTKHMVSRDALNIEGLSEQTILKMIEAGYINEPWDIFDITEEQILKLDGFAKKSAKKIYDGIQGARKQSFDRVIYASGIPLVGKKVSKDIAKEFKTWDKLLPFLSIRSELIQRLSFIDGIGDNIIQSFINNIDLLWKFASYFEFEYMEKKDTNTDNIFSGKKIYCTGTFSTHKKNELKAIVEGLGAEFTSGYAKSLDYLVVGSVKGSSKEDKARKDGVKILQENEFFRMIGR